MVILSLLAVAAIVGAFVLLGRPAFGAGLLTFCLFTRLPEIAESRFHVPTITVPLAIAVGVLGVSAAAKRGYAPTAVPLTLVLLGTRAAVMLLGWPAALNQAEVMPAVLEFVRDGAVIVGLVAAVCTPGALKSAVYGVITAGLLLGGIACLQFARGDYHNTYMELAKAPLVGVVGTTQGNRAAGPLGDPNFFAQSMVVVVALALERAFREPRRLLRTLALVTVGVGSITVLLTLSRGGLIALAAVLVVGVAWFRSWAAVGVMALAAIVAVPVFAPSGFFARLDELGQLRGGTTAVDDPAVLGRFSEMRSAYDMFVDHPLVGIGTNGFPAAYPEYASRLGVENDANDRNAHSLFLQQAAETGAIGLVQLGAVLALMWVAVRRTARRADPVSASIAEGLTVACFGFLTAGLFLHLAYPRLFWCLVGLCLASRQTILTHEEGPAGTAVPSDKTSSTGRWALAERIG